MELAKYKACICEGAAENAIKMCIRDRPLTFSFIYMQTMRFESCRLIL